uniref:CSON007341 protein n=1 Tax=Culicoides sonorensis TaxID=179676 RepID=A0A336KD05_CULSO
MLKPELLLLLFLCLMRCVHTINVSETLHGMSSLSSDPRALPNAETVHRFVANQIDKLEEKYRYYTLHDLGPSESSTGPRLSVKSFKILAPKTSKSSMNVGSISQQTSQSNHDFKNLTKYKPVKTKTSIIPAQQKIPLIKWKSINKIIFNDFGCDLNTPELNLTSDELANITFESESSQFTISKNKPLNLLSISSHFGKIRDGIRICPSKINTSELHEISKMKLEAINFLHNLHGNKIIESALTDYDEITKMTKNLSIKTHLNSKSNENSTILYELKLTEPEIFDLVQLRGSSSPKWSPGFFMSVPSQKNSFEMSQLDDMLSKIWREMSPF